MKEILKQFVFRKMAEQGWLSDQEAGKFIRNSNEEKEPNWGVVEKYKREYISLENQKDRFDDCQSKIISKYRNEYKGAKTKYYLRHEGMEDNQEYKITKAYFNYLKEKGVKEK